MKIAICEHCDEAIIGKAYRVTSEEDGVLLLDMVVCASCALEAKTLQLSATEIRHDQPPVAYPADRRTRVVM